MLIRVFIHPFTHSFSNLGHEKSIFQSEFFAECHLVLPLSVSSIISFLNPYHANVENMVNS
jgi:hypothetical protein